MARDENGREVRPRTVLVTGGSRGWGRAISLRYARPETTLIVNFASNRAAADAVAHEAESRGAKVVLAQGDLAEAGGRETVIEAVEQSGRLDVLIHNAFVLTNAKPLDVSDADFARVMAVGPQALLELVRRTQQCFPDEGGRVVCTLSLATQRLFHVSRGSNYFPMAAAKAVLEICVRYLAVDFLGSDEGRWVTGQILVADGGFSLI